MAEAGASVAVCDINEATLAATVRDIEALRIDCETVVRRTTAGPGSAGCAVRALA